MKIGVVQLETAPSTAEQAVHKIAQALELLADCALVVLPELALCGYADAHAIRRLAEPADGPALRALAQQARSRRQALVMGYAEQHGKQRFNAAQVIDGQGEVLANYRKMHLWGGHEAELFDAGEQLVRFEWQGMRFGVLICYDLDFPEMARSLAATGTDVLLCLSATTVGYDVVPQALIPARAYENGCFVVFANRGDWQGPFPCIGQSRIVGPSGRVLDSVPGPGAAVLRATLDLREVRRWREGHPGVADLRLPGPSVNP